jgi:hypothetical protein
VSFVRGNPVNFNDPTGHDVGCSGYDARRCEGSYNNLEKQLEKRNYTVTPVVEFIYDEMMKNSKGENVKIMRDNNDNGGLLGEAIALESWAGKVAPGHDWDQKPDVLGMEILGGRDPEFQQAGTKGYHFDTWSNIHFGFVGTEAGFSADTLLDGAGAAQALDDIRRGKEPTVDSSVSGLRQFDQLQDRTAIQIGIDLHNQYDSDLQPEDIIWAIEHSNGLETR